MIETTINANIEAKTTNSEFSIHLDLATVNGMARFSTKGYRDNFRIFRMVILPEKKLQAIGLLQSQSSVGLQPSAAMKIWELSFSVN